MRLFFRTLGFGSLLHSTSYRNMLQSTRTDPHSFANLESLVTRHLHLNLTADFSKRILAGSVKLSLDVVQDKVEEAVLDSKLLDIESVSVNSAPTTVLSLSFLVVTNQRG